MSLLESIASDSRTDDVRYVVARLAEGVDADGEPCLEHVGMFSLRSEAHHAAMTAARASGITYRDADGFESVYVGRGGIVKLYDFNA